MPYDADHFPHLRPAPVAPLAPGSLEPDAAEAAEEVTVKPVLAKPEPPRVPAAEPARDDELARAYLAKG